MAKAKKKEAEAAEAPEAEGGEDAAAKKKGFLSKKLIIMVVATPAGRRRRWGRAYFFFFGKPHHEEKPAPVAAKPPAFFDLPDVLVNLQSPGNGRVVFLKAKIVLEMEDEKKVEQVKPLMPRVMDAFQTYLREMRRTDLEGSAGLYRLREELTRRVNLAIAPTKINAVLFKEIVVQ